MTNTTFSLTKENFLEKLDDITALLVSKKVSRRECQNTRLLLEETVVRLLGQVEQPLTAGITSFFGYVSVYITYDGEPVNPFERISDPTSESEDAYRDMIFHANKKILSYSRRNRKNRVTILARTARKHTIYYTISAMILGLLFGFVMRFMPESVSTFISSSILSTMQQLFMKCIFLMLAPVLFFSLVSSFSSLSNLKELGRISGKILLIYLFTTAVGVLVGFLLSDLFFRGELPQLPPEIINSTDFANITNGQVASPLAILHDIIPKNIINPITESNMLQIIFIALLTGVAISALGERVSTIKVFLSEANDVVMRMMSMVIFFMPAIAFSSMASLIYSSKPDALLTLLMYLLTLILGFFLLFLLYAFLIFSFAHVSPISYIKKTVCYLVTPFMLSSSSACIPMTLEFCKNKLGVSKKIASLSIPLGATLNMNGAAMCVALTTIMLGRMCGGSFDPQMYTKLFFMSIMLAMGAAGVPNLGFILNVLCLSALGLPVGSATFILGIWNIIDRFSTAANINGDIATSVLVAKSEAQLDLDIYKS